MRHVHRALAILLLCSSALLAQPESNESTASLRAAYLTIHSELEAHDAGWSVAAKDSELPARLNRAWTLVAHWIAHYLDTNPSASARDIAHAIAALNHAASCPKCSDAYRLDGNAVQLIAGEKAVWVVSASFARAGTFLVLARDADGPFTLRWNIKDLAAQHEATQDEIGNWASNAFSWGDGPLVGRIKPIISSRTGKPRFFVDAHAATIAGGTFNNQISVWEWDGQNAVPLFIKSYAASFDTPPNRFTAERITVHTKADYKSFSTCGACPDPEVSWQIRITPDGVISTAPVWTNKELAACDELFDIIINGRSTSDLAAPQVVIQLRTLIAPLLTADRHQDHTHLLGMLMQHRTIAHNGHQILEITADNLSCGPIRFTIANRNGAIYFADVQVPALRIIVMSSWRRGMTSSLTEIAVPAATNVGVTDDVDLSDGRTISVPLAWYPRLVHGRPEERSDWRLIGRGEGIHWPQLDEDISVEGLIAGRPSGESQRSLAGWIEARVAKRAD